MSESYGGGPTNASAAGAHQPSGTVETAKNEAGEVKNTATEEAGHVAGTAKSEAANVAGEAKNQAKQLYAQTQSELKEQAATQQKRVSEGLRSVGDELGAMARNSENPGLAADLVQQVSERVKGAASWIGDRDPGSLLGEVKSYARRKPGTFIAVAALAGLAAGRLTRALAENAADEKESGGSASSGAPASGGSGATVPPAPPAPPAPPGTGTAGTGTPVYDQSRAAWDDTRPGGGSDDVRRDSV